MENKIRRINKLNYFITSSIIVCQTAIFIYILYYFSFTQLIVNFACWNFILCSLYLIFIFICDTSLYFYEYAKLEELNNALRNTFFQICFSISIGMTLFHLLFIYPSNKDDNQSEIANTFLSKIKNYILNYHLNAGITLVMLIEIIFNRRKKSKFDWSIVRSITYIICAYTIVLHLVKVLFNITGYDFIKNLNFLDFVFYSIIFFILALICYSINHCILNIINKNNNKENKKLE